MPRPHWRTSRRFGGRHRRPYWCLAVMALAVAVSRPAATAPPTVSRNDMWTSAGTFAQLFWSDDLSFTEDRSVHLAVETLTRPVPAAVLSLSGWRPLAAVRADGCAGRGIGPRDAAARCRRKAADDGKPGRVAAGQRDRIRHPRRWRRTHCPPCLPEANPAVDLSFACQRSLSVWQPPRTRVDHIGDL